jgi:hypothetical protein
MISIENRFKGWLKGGGPRPPLGTWLMAAAPATAEALGYCGFDFLVVDMEHVPIEVSDLAHILRAVGCTPADAVVRLAWNDQVLVKRVLDAGAQTVMLPFVQTAEEARLAVSYAKYPPEGVRGVAAVHRGSRFGRAADYLKRANDQVAVIVQLETPRPSSGCRRSPPFRGSTRCSSARGISRPPWAISATSPIPRCRRSSSGPPGWPMRPESPWGSSAPTRTWWAASSATATATWPSGPTSP